MNYEGVLTVDKSEDFEAEVTNLTYDETLLTCVIHGHERSDDEPSWQIDVRARKSTLAYHGHAMMLYDQRLATRDDLGNPSPVDISAQIEPVTGGLKVTIYMKQRDSGDDYTLSGVLNHA